MDWFEKIQSLGKYTSVDWLDIQLGRTYVLR